MPKEKSINPAQAQRKADKAKAVKKGKAETQSRRNEKLARRNPTHLETQLSTLLALESSGGKLTTHEKNLKESLEKDIKGIKKAREALGDSAPKFNNNRERDREGGRDDRAGTGRGRGGFTGRGRGGSGTILGKRRRNAEDESDSDASSVSSEVRSIPMPRDTPPPFPKEILDKWYSVRRERIAREREEYTSTSTSTSTTGGTNANSTPLGGIPRIFPDRGIGKEKEKDAVVMVKEREEAKTVYESKPVIRDLRKEAVSFVPAQVRVKLDRSAGKGGLVEPEEADRLEREGYLGRRDGGGDGVGNGDGDGKRELGRRVQVEEVDDEDG